MNFLQLILILKLFLICFSTSFQGIDLDRLYFQNNFHLLGLDPIIYSIEDEDVQNLLNNHDISNDVQFNKDKELNSQKQFQNLMYQDFSIIGNQLYLKYHQKSKSFGVFTSIMIKKATIIGHIVGKIVKEPLDYYLSYPYPSLNLYISIFHKTNIISLINQSNNYNLLTYIIPNNNRWYIAVVANRDIQIGEELIIKGPGEEDELNQFIIRTFSAYTNAHSQFSSNFYNNSTQLDKDQQQDDQFNLNQSQNNQQQLLNLDREKNIQDYDQEYDFDEDFQTEEFSYQEYFKIYNNSLNNKQQYENYENKSQTQQIQNSNLQQLDIEYLEECVIEDQKLIELIKNNNIYNETDYKYNKKIFDQRFQYLDFQKIQDMDDLIYIRFINDKIGYGAFAKHLLKNNTVIGEYTGVIKQKDNQIDYSWRYLSYFDEYQSIQIDSSQKGNILRFVNDLEDKNVQSMPMPINNQWKVFYVTIQEIQQNQELSIDYGINYWQNKIKLQRTIQDSLMDQQNEDQTLIKNYDKTYSTEF